MSDIYLTELALTEFRSFSQLRVRLPSEPGALIVHGTNGLGKSSFFDGLEWALTGKIDHFEAATKGVESKAYLRRWYASDDRPTQVSVSFSDGQTITRRLDSFHLRVNDFPTITAYLRSPRWRQEIGELHRYLLLTHFLGQSTLSRMTHREPGERWQFLQQPAQSDRATRIAAALHGHGSSAMARSYERKAKELTDQVTELEQLMKLEDQQWRESQADGAIDDTHALAEVELLVNQLTQLTTRFGVRPFPDSRALDPTIENVQAMLDRWSQLASTRESSLARARSLLDEQEHAEANLAANAAAIVASQLQIDSDEPTGLLQQQEVAAYKVKITELETERTTQASELRLFTSVQGLRAQAGSALTR